MNSYELAKIMEVHDGSQVWEHGLEIADMLRQQADRIAELEADVDKKLTLIKMYEATWTPQTKPLSDAEIEKIENRIYCKTTAKGKSPYEYATQLARAIEAKVRGEK